MLAIAAGG
jgi:ankyrin repeat protein